MPYTAYPTGDDILLQLQSTELVEDPPTEAAALIDYDARMLEVISEWEERTGYVPFLAAEAEATETYSTCDLHNGVLELNGGYVSISSLTIGGTTQVSGTDYEALPRAGQPIKRVRFFGCGADSVISVTGIKGYSTEMPAEVRGAMIDRGCSLVAPQLSLQISGGTTDIKAGKVALSFVRASGNRVSSGGPLSGESATWDERWKSAVRRYRR